MRRAALVSLWVEKTPSPYGNNRVGVPIEHGDEALQSVCHEAVVVVEEEDVSSRGLRKAYVSRKASLGALLKSHKLEPRIAVAHDLLELFG
jgi:hypothetical protein